MLRSNGSLTHRHRSWTRGTKTNDAIKELQKIFKPRQQPNETTRRNRSAIKVQGTDTRVCGAATRVLLPTIDENEIGTRVQKRYNNTIHNCEATQYYTDGNLYFISYENGENEKINERQLNRYRCTDRHIDTTRRITRLQARLHQANVAKKMNKAYARTGAKLPAHFANVVFDEDTGQMLDYKKLINHNKKETTTSDRSRHIPLHPQERRTERKEDNIRPILL